MRTLFVGDLHLSADRPDITQAFLTFLDTQLHDTDALYILGDLFEVWVGDDIAEPFANELADKIKRASQKLPIYFIHGNRDFLISNAFAKRSGMTLLPEVYTLDLYGVPSVILHGDSLCTLDKSYQRFRKFRNMSWAKWLYAHLPKSKRLDIAAKLRTKSQSSNQQKSYSIMDVEPDAVLKLLDTTKTEQMIHGHTHRPAVHQLANGKRRIVVGDWYEQGSMLSVSQDKIELIELPFSK
ncbi:UDP-2,3-diacylglucosamine diphosphatase [Shewanella sp. MBTL60-007]|uniref:UDP-2,3-diacylglucosamine diphosphatase n=1 Tax=Shewanella sp. MBTL60-007 TaxID=2815911 RepID=UPI001BC41809|nr:UDP-2,3-diacylglucosamine diphosphatase [Shewanella sp. MBTL60-007]GIU17560.1 UDP-2,3-diacylglucosamine hydrolase [Shewanella sp. MBTL60-007]